MFILLITFTVVKGTRGIGTITTEIIIVTRLTTSIIVLVIVGITVTLKFPTVPITTMLVLVISIILIIVTLKVTPEVKVEFTHPELSGLCTISLGNYNMFVPSLHLTIEVHNDQFIIISRKLSKLDTL